jgi:hypothetical protein
MMTRFAFEAPSSDDPILAFIEILKERPETNVK